MRNKFRNFEELLRCASEVKSTTKNLNGYVKILREALLNSWHQMVEQARPLWF